ncbi:Na+/H+ antiporter NhaC family protein [uncultured Alistipes sp.]|uniref:Na+/H+ antiporter NhaC family protein n=1 Tax=uncultured Alistipes sp. TaxID=538949 RepID=UPI002619D764|nr:Na+/H+ antiporter NhaC family protein [uncultured Alistipes sp.]
MKNGEETLPAVWVSAIPLAVLASLLFLVIRCFGGGAIDGGSQIALLSASSVAVMLAMGIYGCRWSRLEEAIVDNIHSSASAILILLLIGAIAGTWMVSGVVPTMICYGLEILHPSFFLVASCVVCAGVSLMTGSSWTTIATIGVALMGIGRAMGFAEGWVAGAIVSGAYFGDNVSLLSDTTVLASSTVGVPVFDHIRYMLRTTVPSFVVALAVFTVAGLTLPHGDAAQADLYAAALRSTFRVTPWLLAVPLVTGVLIARKWPAIVTLFVAAVLASVAMVAAQPALVARVAGAAELDLLSGFKGVLMSCYGPTAIPSGDAQIDGLIATRGMAGMLNTVWLIVCAMCFGGVMTGSGMLRALTEVFLRFVRRTFPVVASTVGAGIFFNLCTADQYISIILSGRLFRDLYADRGLEARLLSRSVEDSATVCSVLIPWNSCGMTQATVLGVSTFVYMPYCIFNLVSPLMSLAVAATGWGIRRRKVES